MPGQTYRVIQWATGKVGQVAIRHFAASPAFELVGVLVTNPAKVGKDAGEKNVVTPMGPFYPTEWSRADIERIEAACADGGTSFHGSGIHPGFAGDLLGQHYAWTAWVEDTPLIEFHMFWVMGREHMEPIWDCGESGYRVAIAGEPPAELVLRGGRLPDGTYGYPGLEWTALAGVNVIPDVCDARPGLITHLDLGVACLRGQVHAPGVS